MVVDERLTHLPALLVPFFCLCWLLEFQQRCQAQVGGHQFLVVVGGGFLNALAVVVLGHVVVAARLEDGAQRLAHQVEVVEVVILHVLQQVVHHFDGLVGVVPLCLIKGLVHHQFVVAVQVAQRKEMAFQLVREGIELVFVVVLAVLHHIYFIERVSLFFCHGIGTDGQPLNQQHAQ